MLNVSRPSRRVFAILTFLGQKSVGSGRGGQVIDAILRVLSAQLHGSAAPAPDPAWLAWASGGPHVDTHLVSWLLLYLSLCLDALTPARKTEAEKTKENGNSRHLLINVYDFCQKSII